MRLAYCTPLPPLATGIADYSAELLPALAAQVDLEVFAEPAAAWRRNREAATSALPGIPVWSMDELEARHRSQPFDLLLYHLGNNVHYHHRIYQAALRWPGVVVLHEALLHHLVREMTLMEAGPEAYLAELRHAYGAAGVAAGGRLLAARSHRELWQYPLFERVVDASRGVIVFNRTARRRLRLSRPRALVARVPQHVVQPDLPAPEELRRQLGLPAAGVIFGCSGFLTPQKRLDVVLAAFARVHAAVPDTQLLLVGATSADYDMPRLLAGEQGAGVRHLGRVDGELFMAALGAVDVGINLRYPSGGETSATLLRLLALGKAVIVSNTGSFAELPPGSCARVAVDAMEEDVLAAYMMRLAEDPALRRQLGAAARRHADTEHSLEASVRAYLGFFERVLAAPAAPVAAVTPEPLLEELGAAIFDLGLGGDEELAREVAATVIDLGWR